MGFPIARSRKYTNHDTAHAAQHAPNQYPQIVVASLQMIRATGTAVIAANRLYQPRPRPSTLWNRLYATHRWVKVKSSVSAAPLMEAASAPGPKARYAATDPVTAPEKMLMLDAAHAPNSVQEQHGPNVQQ